MIIVLFVWVLPVFRLPSPLPATTTPTLKSAGNQKECRMLCLSVIMTDVPFTTTRVGHCGLFVSFSWKLKSTKQNEWVWWRGMVGFCWLLAFREKLPIHILGKEARCSGCCTKYCFVGQLLIPFQSRLVCVCVCDSYKLNIMPTRKALFLIGHLSNWLFFSWSIVDVQY